MSIETPPRTLRHWDVLREDVEWMARTGCTFERAADRLGVSTGSIRRAFARHGVELPRAWRMERW